MSNATADDLAGFAMEALALLKRPSAVAPVWATERATLFAPVGRTSSDIVVRVESSRVEDEDLEQRLYAYETLGRFGIPVARLWDPAAMKVELNRGTRWVTLWENEGPASATGLDAELLGSALAAVHRIPASAVDNVPEGLSTSRVREAIVYAAAGTRPAISASRRAWLESRLDKVATLLATPPVAHHGELWLENVLMTTRGPVIMEFASVGPGPAVADLALVVASSVHHAHRGHYASLDLAALASGYGAPLPDLGTAEAVATLHRTVQLVDWFRSKDPLWRRRARAELAGRGRPTYAGSAA